MENSFTITTDLSSRPAPKKYKRLIPEQRKRNREILILETECFLDITSDLYETVPAEGLIAIEENFQKKFGYPIPTSANDYKKTDFKTYISNSNILNSKAELICQPSPWSITKITYKVLEYIKDQEHEKKAMALEKKVAQEKLRREMEAENKRLIEKNKEREKRGQEKKIKKGKAKKAAQLEEKKQRIIEAQKRDLAAKNVQKKIKFKQPVQLPEKTIVTQKRAIKSKLIKTNKCQTEAQLKTFLSNICLDEDRPCTGDILGPNAAFHYDQKTNELVILIGDEIRNYKFDCCES